MTLKGWLTLAAAVAASMLISLLLNLSKFYSGHWWWSVIFMFVLYLLVNIAFSLKTEPHKSAQILLGVVFGKMILLFTSVLLYSHFFKPELFSFCVHFILHYILFTVLEVRYLLLLVKNKYSPGSK